MNRILNWLEAAFRNTITAFVPGAFLPHLLFMTNSDEPLVSAHDEFIESERAVERHASEFKKELGLTDLVFTQILFIVG